MPEPHCTVNLRTASCRPNVVRHVLANVCPTTPTMKMVAEDTFLPVLKVPKAIFIATVKF